jgi:hypothetical protein
LKINHLATLVFMFFISELSTVDLLKNVEHERDLVQPLQTKQVSKKTQKHVSESHDLTIDLEGCCFVPNSRADSG